MANIDSFHPDEGDSLYEETHHLSEEERKGLFSLFPEENPNPIFCINYGGQILYSNQKGLDLLDKIPSSHEFFTKTLRDTLHKRENEHLKLSLVNKIYEFSVVFVKEEGIAFLYGIDITERRDTEIKLERLSRVINESINIVFITDNTGSIEYVNSTFEKITGFSKEEAIGKNPGILASKETDPMVYEDMWEKILAGKTWRGLLKNRKKSGDFYWANGFITPIENEEGEITHFLAIQEDITEKIATEERLRYLSIYDRMTGLMERVHFMNLLDHYLQETTEERREAVLLQINIDGFKLINDSFGHSVGDAFLKSFADFLQHQIKEREDSSGSPPMIARLGGDEFAVFFEAKNKEEGIQTAETIRRNVEDYRFLGGSIRVTVSIGLVMYPEHGKKSKDLISQANAATLQAKELGQNRYAIYSDSDQYLQQVQSILEKKQLIIKAIEEDGILPYFQPILNLHTQEINHYEALARLSTSHGEVLPPGSFIPIAERYGLISRIDGIITRKTIEYLAMLSKRDESISFSMNLSGKHLGDEKMLSYLRRVIEDSGAHPGAIVFEITETAAIDNRKRAISFVRSLKELGCKFSLDDFGVGYTSFVHLIDMDLDYIKIDGSFIRLLMDNKRDRVIVKTIVDMAKNLKIETIAEFVEKRGIIYILKELGVDYAQGYCIGKPAPVLKNDWDMCT